MLTESEKLEVQDLSVILGNLVFLRTGEISPCVPESECNELLDRYRILDKKYCEDRP